MKRRARGVVIATTTASLAAYPFAFACLTTARKTASFNGLSELRLKDWRITVRSWSGPVDDRHHKGGTPSEIDLDAGEEQL
jgi:hypothetical protein